MSLKKAEAIHKNRLWRGLDDVELVTFAWVDWFNHRQLLRPIGDQPGRGFISFLQKII